MTTETWPLHPFTTATARRAGRTARELSTAVLERRLRRVFRGVYVAADIEIDTQIFAEAASLVVNRDSVVCDEAAAMLHGIDTYRYTALEGVPPLTTCTLRGTRSTKRSQCDGRSRDLRRQDWVEIGGLRVTTPVRTAMDLACKLPRWRAKAALDAFAHAFGLTVGDYEAQLPRYRGRRGCRQLRELVPLVDARIESPRESRVHLEILDAGLTPPQPQYWFDVDGVPTYRVDFCWPRARVIVEYDGEEWHTDPAARSRDAGRRAWLRQRGWTVIVLTKQDLQPDQVGCWVQELRTLVHSAA